MRISTVSVGDIIDRLVEDSRIIGDVSHSEITRLPKAIYRLPCDCYVLIGHTLFGMVYGLVAKFGFQYVRTVSRVCSQ